MAFIKKRMTKVEEYPQPHSIDISMLFELDNAAIDSTILPWVLYDEGQGNPTALETNPRNAAFAVTTKPNCFVNSRIDQILGQITFAMTSKALDDNIPAVKMAFMPIKMAFIEDYTADDELSGLAVQEIVEMQTESTDRQGFPLYTGSANKIVEKFAGGATLHADVDGLTTTQVIEGVAFNQSTFYNAIHFQTNAGKIKSVVRGLKWITLTQNRPVAKVSIRIDSKTKRMNEFAFFGVLIHVPILGSLFQLPGAGDITAATNYVSVDAMCRYNEWNHDFNHRMI